MKNNITILFLFLFFVSGFSQKYKFEYTGRFGLSIKNENLKGVKSINEIVPELWRKLELPFKERDELERQRRMNYPLVYYVYPQSYNIYDPENYTKLINYISVEISAVCEGKVLMSRSINDTLTSEQKDILSAADPGTDIVIKTTFKFKDDPEKACRAIEGKLVATIVPAREAEYPGGFKELTEYLTENVFNRISEKDNSGIQHAIVKFAVSEDGKIVDARLGRTSGDKKMDEILLDAFGKMPKWKPAENSNGKKVRQEFSIPLGGGGC